MMPAPLLAMPVLAVPVLAVIVPAYGHPVLLAEALQSVLAQRDAPDFAVVVVDDGCRLAETGTVCLLHALADPRVTVLRRPNGGPGAARNRGIDHVLTRWPSVEAAFFLDADNRLSPTALRDAYAVWREDRTVGWVYPTITSFGLHWTANYEIPYSPLLHVVGDNMCDTGSLVSRAVLDAGVRFDEDARSGYEDWDFWLQCLDRGFVGRHAPFGFAYRQRPESRFRTVNRQRGAAIEYLRARHRRISRPANLLEWEHATNPRYAYRACGSSDWFCFTDPARRDGRVPEAAFVERFFAALAQPDEVLLPPFQLWGEDAAFAELGRFGLLPGLLVLLEREAAGADLVAVTMAHAPTEIGLRVGVPDDRAACCRRAVLWLATAEGLRAAALGPEPGGWDSLADDAPEPSIIEIAVHAPFAPVAGGGPDPVLASLRAIRRSAFNTPGLAGWTWRPAHFPARALYYLALCDYLDVPRLLPRLRTRAVEVAMLLPIASYGGAEKVAYATARVLRDQGWGVHLVVVGPPAIRIVSEYRDVFDTVSFLADPAFPIWGGPATSWGQETFLPDAPEVTRSGLTGLLASFDLVVNCHSAPANAAMGALRALGVRTATYLHVIDATPRGRAVGHPYLAIGFEHAYDLVLTCSRQLASDLHGLGVPGEKILPIRNAASVVLPDAELARMRSDRARPRGRRPFRLVYLGRLDRQKGVERLWGAAGALRAAGAAVEWRIVGSALLEADGVNWAARFAGIGIAVEPPVYDGAAIAAILGWADALVLPSRWEGAPLVIPEAQRVGCIPIATAVGAVCELLTDDEDGLVLRGGSDAQVAAELADAVRALLADDAARRRLAARAMDTAAANRWADNVQPFCDWIRARFPASADPQPARPAMTTETAS